MQILLPNRSPFLPQVYITELQRRIKIDCSLQHSLIPENLTLMRPFRVENQNGKRPWVIFTCSHNIYKYIHLCATLPRNRSRIWYKNAAPSSDRVRSICCDSATVQKLHYETSPDQISPLLLTSSRYFSCGFLEQNFATCAERNLNLWSAKPDFCDWHYGQIRTMMTF